MYKSCSECQKQFLYTACSPPCSAKIRASDKDLPVNLPLKSYRQQTLSCKIAKISSFIVLYQLFWVTIYKRSDNIRIVCFSNEKKMTTFCPLAPKEWSNLKNKGTF